MSIQKISLIALLSLTCSAEASQPLGLDDEYESYARLEIAPSVDFPPAGLKPIANLVDRSLDQINSMFKSAPPTEDPPYILDIIGMLLKTD